MEQTESGGYTCQDLSCLHINWFFHQNMTQSSCDEVIWRESGSHRTKRNFSWFRMYCTKGCVPEQGARLQPPNPEGWSTSSGGPILVTFHDESDLWLTHSISLLENLFWSEIQTLHKHSSRLEQKPRYFLSLSEWAIFWDPTQKVSEPMPRSQNHNEPTAKPVFV